MRVTVEIVAKELKKTAKDIPYTSLKLSDGRWINMSGDHRALRGSIDITEPKTFGNQLWSKIEKPEPSEGTERKEQTPETGDQRPEAKTNQSKSLKETFTMIEILHSKSKTLEPASPEARAILTSAMLSGWLDGKLVEK